MFPHRSAEEDNLPACQAEAEAAAGVPGAFVGPGVRAVQEGGGWFGPWSWEASGPWGEGEETKRGVKVYRIVHLSFGLFSIHVFIFMVLDFILTFIYYIYICI